MTRTIKFIQFHNITEALYDNPTKFKMYPLWDESDQAEFTEMREDDEGDEYEETDTYDAISFYHSLDDYLREDSLDYIKLRRLRYSIIEMEVNCDSNDKPLWNVA